MRECEKMDLVLTYTDITAFPSGNELTEELTAAVPEYFRIKAAGTGNKLLERQRLAGGLLLACALKQRGYDEKRISVTEGAWGKPLLEEPEGVCFSLSHSGDLVMLAVSDAETGCDIQQVRSGRDIPARFFTDRENEVLDGSDAASGDELFTRLWARKESYIKATGEGMRRDLRSFCVLDGCTPPGYIFFDRMLCGYAAAACVRAEEGAEKPVERMAEISFLPFQKLVNVIL